MAKKPKRLVRGKDWHAWAWEFGRQHKPESKIDWQPGDLYHYTEGSSRPKTRISKHGNWVRVKFVKVKRG